MIKFIYFIVLVMLNGSFVFGQTISGEVKDSLSNTALPFYTILLKAYKNSSIIVSSQSTSELGKFKFDNLEAGQYLLQVSYLGYRKKEIIIDLTHPQQGFSDMIILMSTQTKTLATVTVAGKKQIYSFGAGKIIYDVENDSRVVGKNGMEILRLAPLISINGMDGIQLKGKSDFMIFVNGKRSAVLSSNPSEFLRTLNHAQISKIEIITNPSARYSAEGTAGIINIITKTNIFKNITTLDLGYDTYHAFNSSLSLSGQKAKWGYALSLAKTDWKNGTTVNTQLLQVKNRSTNISGFTIPKNNIASSFGSIKYEANKKNKFDLDFMISDGLGNTDRQFYTTNGLVNTQNKLKDFGYTISTDWEHKFDSLSSIVISYKTMNERNKNQVQSNISELNLNKTNSTENTVQIDFQNSHFQFGSSAIFRNLNSKIAFTSADYNYNIQQNVFSAYASYYDTVFKNYVFEFGFREEYTVYNGTQMLNFTTESVFLKNKYAQLFPSLNISRYFEKSAINFSVGYSKRIFRPQLYYLNPFINSADPFSPTTGNLALDYQLADNIEVSISKVGKNNAFNMLSLSYSRNKNSIIDFLFPVGDSSISTFPINFKRQHLLGLSQYASFTPSKWLRGVISSNLYYTFFPKSILLGIDSSKYELNTNGVYGSFQLNLSGKIYKKLNWDITTLYSLPDIHIQGKSSSFLFQSITFSASFLKNKLHGYLSLRQPYFKNFNYKATYAGKNFMEIVGNTSPQRRIWVGITYSFGKSSESKTSVRKKIENQDRLNKSLIEQIK